MTTTEEVSKPPSFPSYPEMIMAAMDAAKDTEGLSKASISRYMESTYGDMPAGHLDLLTNHLNTLKQKGELLFVKNNYIKPGSYVAPKRGRGRPPKAKNLYTQEAHVTGDGSVKSRGRPRKDPTAAAPAAKKAKADEAAKSESGRPRGRPRKVEAVAQSGVEAN